MYPIGPESFCAALISGTASAIGETAVWCFLVPLPWLPCLPPFGSNQLFRLVSLFPSPGLWLVQSCGAYLSLLHSKPIPLAPKGLRPPFPFLLDSSLSLEHPFPFKKTPGRKSVCSNGRKGQSSINPDVWRRHHHYNKKESLVRSTKKQVRWTKTQFPLTTP